jgi:hypothetical protein
MSLAGYARSGQSGNISKSGRARTGDVEKQIVPTPQPRVPSNIPGAGVQGVPPAEADELGAFARRGNVEMQPRIVSAQTGLATHGPAVMSSLARMGGQVKLAPGQFGAWAHPRDPVDVYGKPSDQVTSDPNRPGSLPPPAAPVY